MLSYKIKGQSLLGVTGFVVLCASMDPVQANVLSHHQRLTQSYASDVFLEQMPEVPRTIVLEPESITAQPLLEPEQNPLDTPPWLESEPVPEIALEPEPKTRSAKKRFIVITPAQAESEPVNVTEVEAMPELYKPHSATLVVNKELLNSAFQPVVYSAAETAQKRVSLQDLVRAALNWHPSVRQAQSQVLASEENIQVAKSGYYPQISAGLSSSYRDSSDQDNEALSFNASQMLYDFGKTASTVREAQHSFSREQANLELTREQLIQNTVLVSIELMRLQEKEIVAQQQIEELNRIWELAKERAELGASTQSDPLQALSRKEAAVALMWELQAQKDTWLQQLQSLTGYSAPLSVDLAFPNYFGLECSNLSLNLERAPEMRIAEEMRLAALAALDRSTADLYPTLSLDLGYDQYFKSRSVLRNGQIDKRNSDFTVGLSLNMSLFEGGGRFARRGASAHLLQAADSEKETIALEVTKNFEESKVRQELLGSRLEVLQERVRNIEKAKEIYLDQYLSLGTRSLLDLLNAEQEIYQAKADYIDNKYEMYKAQVTCLYYGSQLKYVFNVQ